MTRPLTIAEIFDRAVTLIVRRWRPAVVITVIASLPQAASALLFVLDPRIARHTGGAVVLLTFVSGLLTVYAFAALVMLFAGEDDDPGPFALFGAAFASFWRLFRISLMTGFLIVVAVAVIAILVSLLSTVGGVVAGTVVIVAGVLAGIPLAFAMELAICNAAIEGTGATKSVGNALYRVSARGSLLRSALLGYATTLCYFVPSMLVTAVAGMFVVTTKQTWIAIAAQPLDRVVTMPFFAALMTVAAIDYRVRSEGIDLEAALDMPGNA